MQGPRGWWVVAAFTAVVAVNQMLWQSFAAITTGTADRYDVSVGAIGWLSLVFPLAYVVLAIPAGALLGRNLHRWLAVGALLTGLGAMVRLGDSYAWVLAGHVLGALAQPLVVNAIPAVSQAHLPAHRRPLGIAISSAGLFAGLLPAYVLGAVFGADDVRLLLSVQAVLCVGATVALLVGLRAVGAPAVRTADERTQGTFAAVWSDRTVRALAVVVFVGFGVFTALSTWLQALLEPRGVTEAAVGTLLVIMIVAGIVGSAALPGPVAARGAEKPVLRVTCVVTSLTCLGLGITASLPVAAIGLAATGLLLLAALPVVLEVCERRTGAGASTATAIIMLAGNAGGLVVALVVERLVEHPLAAFGVLAGLGVLGLAVLPLVAATPARLAARA